MEINEVRTLLVFLIGCLASGAGLHMAIFQRRVYEGLMLFLMSSIFLKVCL